MFNCLKALSSLSFDNLFVFFLIFYLQLKFFFHGYIYIPFKLPENTSTKYFLFFIHTVSVSSIAFFLYRKLLLNVFYRHKIKKSERKQTIHKHENSRDKREKDKRALFESRSWQELTNSSLVICDETLYHA